MIQGLALWRERDRLIKFFCSSQTFPQLQMKGVSSFFRTRNLSGDERLKAASDRQSQVLEHIRSQNAIMDGLKEENTKLKRRLLRSEKKHSKMQKKINALRRRQEIDREDIVVEVSYSSE